MKGQYFDYLTRSRFMKSLKLRNLTNSNRKDKFKD